MAQLAARGIPVCYVLDMMRWGRRSGEHAERQTHRHNLLWLAGYPPGQAAFRRRGQPTSIGGSGAYRSTAIEGDLRNSGYRRTLTSQISAGVSVLTEKKRLQR